jgi:DNA-binding GntR family transcriptional regulator
MYTVGVSSSSPQAVIDAVLGRSTAASGFDANAGTWSPVASDHSLAARVADQLAEAIIDGRLPSGTRLSEPGIAEAFDISRTPVREALYMLERDDLVERPPRKGARVARLTAKQALDVYICRAHLYGLSARMCARSLTESDLAELRRIVAGMDAAVATADVRSYYRLNLDFHDFVGRATGNDMLLRLMGGMGRLTLRFRFMSLTVPGRLEKSRAAHHRLLECLEAHDGVAAERTVREIVSAAGDAVLAHFFGDSTRPVAAATLESDGRD